MITETLEELTTKTPRHKEIQFARLIPEGLRVFVPLWFKGHSLRFKHDDNQQFQRQTIEAVTQLLLGQGRITAGIVADTLKSVAWRASGGVQ